jgi:hypothetical protein
MNTFHLRFIRSVIFKSIIVMVVLSTVAALAGINLTTAQAKEPRAAMDALLLEGNISGTVRDADTTLPIGGVKVEVNTGASTFTNLDGSYILGLDAGTYTVTASAAYYVTEFVADVVVETGMTALDFNLVHEPVFLTGIVEDAYNRLPLDGAKVELDTGQYDMTDGDGVYTINVPPGVYTVTASIEDYIPQTVTDVVLTQGEVDLNFDLVHSPVPVTLTGLVSDAYFLTPITGATVSLNTGETFVTLNPGRYSIVVDPGTYTITASAPGYVTQVKGPLTISLGTLVTDFNLEPLTCPTVSIDAMGIEVEDLQVDFTPDVNPLLGISYLWDFGDGHTSIEESPTHVYAVYTTYPVTLDVENICGSTDSWEGTVTLEKVLTTFLPMVKK